MFDFDRESPSFIQAAYCLFFYIIFFVLCYKDYYTCRWVRKNHTPKLSSTIIILFFIITLTYFVDTDYFHYYEYLKTFSQGNQILTAEPVYQVIASIAQYKYLIFRALIWGSGIFIVYFTAKIAKIKPDFVLYFLFILYIGIFCYARASLGMAILFLGFYYLNCSKRNLKLRITGIIIMSISIFFHSSMIVALLCCLLAPLLKWSRYRIVIYIISIPILSWAIGIFLNYIINSGSSEVELVSKLIFYSELDNEAVRTLLGKIQTLLGILTFLLPLYFISYRVYFNNKVIDKKPISFEINLYKIAFILIAISFAFLNIGLTTEVFSYRIRFMAMLPIVYSFTGLLQKGIIIKKEAQICLLIGFIYTIMGMGSVVSHA